MSLRLSESDRQLFALVTEATFVNPFGERRDHLNAQMGAGAPYGASWVGRMLERVGSRLAALGKGKLDVRKYGEADRELVEHTVLFETFHRFVEPLDALIAAQERAPAALRVELAPSFLASLTERGISAERAHRILELCYQMRRAFTFIARGLVGQSPSMRKLRQELWAAVFTCDMRRYERVLWNRMEDFSTILVGETGSGKGAAAAAIGLSGFIPFDAKARKFAYSFVESFVPIHLNEFPETLFESEIFGHKKGAFTGAVDNYEGALSRCKAQGTVFLDEIGEATLAVQVKLLRVLQDREYTPVGSREPRRFSGRIVAATHRSLAELRREGAMRDDFFFRLSSNVIEVPPLRRRIAEQPHELSQLVEHLCSRISGASDAELVADVTRAIERDLGQDYAFRGNVRELEQCVRRVLLTGRCPPDDRREHGTEPSLSNAVERGDLNVEQLTARYCAMLYARNRSYVETARITGLDRRTVKKLAGQHAARPPTRS